MNPVKSLINFAKLQLGVLAGGDYIYTIYRPNYNQVDNTGVFITTGCFYLEPDRDVFSDDKLKEFEFYTLCGNPYAFQNGDVITCSNSNIPVVTVTQQPDEQEFLAIKTNKIGNIQDIIPIYENVRFDYAEATRPGGEDFSQDLTSYADPKRQIVTYFRPGIKEGMVFHDQDNGWIWKITLVDRRTNLLIIHLAEPNRV